MIRTLTISLMLLQTLVVTSQNTVIRGYANMDVRYQEANPNLYFLLGEQDLFITREITDRIDFLGESVFKYSPQSPTTFNVSLERLIISYNYKGNHSILLGKHHTPFSYWNDTYHHGRVFFPTAERPLLFSEGLIEYHTTGIAFQGANLGDYNIGYNVMIGNGIGSQDVLDDNNSKSLTLNLTAKPTHGMKFGLTAYRDHFSSKARNHHIDQHDHDTVKAYDITQMAGGAFFKYKKKKIHILSEAHLINNNHDSIGRTMNKSMYAYFGYKIKDSYIPYIKFDYTSIDKAELFYRGLDTKLLTLGVAYEFGYLAIAKLEYNRIVTDFRELNSVNLQIAVGF
jgi:hypothetical protein